jgi:hypothetical protein
MRVSAPRLSTNSGNALLTSTISLEPQSRELYYSIPAEHADWFATDRCDGFVVGLILQAMTRGEDIFVDGPLSSRLYHSLQQFFIPMIARAFENLSAIKIIPSSLTTARLNGAGVATGFSGGIDSFAAFIQHYVKEESADHRISHFLFHNAGSHGEGDEGRVLFRQRFERVQRFAHEVGIPLVPVDSNITDVLPLEFLTMHSAINASVPLILQNQFQRFYYASAYTYADCGVALTDDFARFDPLVMHLFSTESVECVSTGCEMTRVEKTELVSGYEPSYRHLNVCVDPKFEGRNCSVCFKCRRTILTLELLGVADRYSGVFDLDKFRRIRPRYLLESLGYERASFEAEIADLIRRQGKGVLAGAFRLREVWDKLAWR